MKYFLSHKLSYFIPGCSFNGLRSGGDDDNAGSAVDDGPVVMLCQNVNLLCVKSIRVFRLKWQVSKSQYVYHSIFN